MRILFFAVAAALVLVSGLRWYASAEPLSALLTYDATVFAETPEDVAEALGGPLTTGDIATIKRISRAEVEQAFSGLRIRFVDEGRAFWRLRVVPSVTPRTLSGRAMQSAAGASYAFGFLGGGGFLSFTTLALKAVVYAPPGTSRNELVDAIGRGIGRSAVHEFTHLILGSPPIHSDDESSYEFETADRASQYYGQLRWTAAWPLLERKLGR